MASTSYQEVPSNSQRRLESKELPSVRFLGKGLSGFIYETTWLGNRYARKDFPLGSLKRTPVFEKDAKALLGLDHPNIVKCSGYTVGRSSCSLLLEYVDDDLQNTVEKRIEEQRKKKLAGSGNTLRSRAFDVDEIQDLISSKLVDDISATRIPFEVPEAVDIMLQIASGMEYLHDNGIVHGDLKPNNVLLYSTSGQMMVKVTDFGLIGTKKRIKLVSKRTRHSEVLMWKAPERFGKILGPLTKDSDNPFTESDTGSDEETGRSDKGNKLPMADVYSFGLICSLILGGDLLNPALSLTKLREQRLGDFKPELPSACPKHLRSLIYSTLDTEPSRRPTFSDICTVLEAFQSKQLPLQNKVEGKRKSKEMEPPLIEKPSKVGRSPASVKQAKKKGKETEQPLLNNRRDTGRSQYFAQRAKGLKREDNHAGRNLSPAVQGFLLRGRLNPLSSEEENANEEAYGKSRVHRDLQESLNGRQEPSCSTSKQLPRKFINVKELRMCGAQLTRKYFRKNNNETVSRKDDWALYWEQRELRLKQMKEMCESVQKLCRDELKSKGSYKGYTLGRRLQLQQPNTTVLKPIRENWDIGSIKVNRMRIQVPIDDATLHYPTEALFEVVVQEERVCFRNFVAALTKYAEGRIRSDGFEFERKSNSLRDVVDRLFPHANYEKTWHFQYGIEAWLSQRIFKGFGKAIVSKSEERGQGLRARRHASWEEYQMLSRASPADAINRAGNVYCRSFYMFCKLTLHIIQDELKWQELWPSNLVKDFLEVMKHVRQEHNLAIVLNVKLIGLHGSPKLFDGSLMEPVETPTAVKIDSLLPDTQHVEFLVRPGFVVRELVIKCQVYLSPSDNLDYFLTQYLQL